MKLLVVLLGLVTAGTAQAQTHPDHCPVDQVRVFECSAKFKGAPSRTITVRLGESSACLNNELRFTLNFDNPGKLVKKGLSTGKWGETFQGDFGGGDGMTLFLGSTPREQYVQMSRDIVFNKNPRGDLVELDFGVRYRWACIER